MFSPQKRIFAGKGNLQAEPFCPIITNDSGYLSLMRINKPSRRFPSFDGIIKAEPTVRTRRSKA